MHPEDHPNSSLDSTAEKAYATVNGQAFPELSSTLSLHLSPSLNDDPSPSATPLVFKSLPLDTTAGALFDLCRPFGPLHRVVLQLAEGPRRASGIPPVFKGQALVTFYVRYEPVYLLHTLILCHGRTRSTPIARSRSYTAPSSAARPSSSSSSSLVEHASRISPFTPPPPPRPLRGGQRRQQS